MTRQPGNQGYNTPQVGFSQIGRCYTYNLFSPTVRRGDHLYKVVRNYTAESANFVDPNGQIITGRKNYPHSFLQIRGFTDSHHDTVPVFAANSYDTSSQFRRDNMRVNQEYLEYDVNDDGELVLSRDMREQEVDAAAEVERRMSQLVYDAYTDGYVMKIGIARSVHGQQPTPQEISVAHRDQEAMKKMQLVHIYNGL